MTVLAANLSMLFNEYEFLNRFEAAAKSGFSAVEYLFPYDFSVGELRAKLQQHNLEQALFNAPPGDWQRGERGIACLPGRQAEFREGIAQAIGYALELGNKRIHVMAGLKPETLSYQEAKSCYVANLKLAAKLAAPHALTILIEPINNVDMPNYFVNWQAQGVELIQEIAEPNVKLQFDVYHCQIMQGNVVETFRKYRDYIDHVQIAGVPGRHEPNLGELNYPYILQSIKEAGFSGYIGCEYKPLKGTRQGLDWISMF